MQGNYMFSNENVNDFSFSTSHTLHEDPADKNRDMLDMNSPLITLIHESLISRNKSNQLQSRVFHKYDYTIIPPIPSLYFLPYHILLFDQHAELHEIRDEIYSLNQEYSACLSLFSPNEFLHIKTRNEVELVRYNIRKINLPQHLHRKRQFLDEKHLIDKLFQYYSQYYRSLYFQETAILILFWAFQKQLLDDQIAQHQIKLLFICIFVNLGYGASNIIHRNLNNISVLRENRKMYNYTKINENGETEISGGLINNFINYTIQQIDGFYIPTKGKILKIKNIIPLCFPIMPLNCQKDQKEKKEIEESIKSSLNSREQEVSICNNIFRIFKFLHDKFKKTIKLAIDFEQVLAYREEQSQELMLQIVHPILKKTICTIKDFPMNNLRKEVNKIYYGFRKHREIHKIIQEMITSNKRNRTSI